jgi:hypothetical protein
MERTQWVSIAILVPMAAGLACGSSEPSKGFSVLYQTQNNTDFDIVPAIFSIRGSSPNDVWATAQFGTAVHDTGGHWAVVPTPAMGSLADLTGVTATNAYALDVVRNDMYQWNGREWDEKGGPRDLRFGIWADSTFSVWAVGATQEHWDGAAWSTVPSTVGGDLGNIDGVDAGSMFATTVDGGGVARYDGTSWTTLSSPSGGTLYGLWVDSATDVWFVGAKGLIQRWDGSALANVDGGTAHDLVAVTGTGPNDVWAGGSTGTVIHWDGASWSYATTPSGQDINCVWSPRPNEVWIGDVSGAVLRYIP